MATRSLPLSNSCARVLVSLHLLVSHFTASVYIAPNLVGTYWSTWLFTGASIDISADNRYCYVTANYYSYVVAVDVTDPTDPSLAGYADRNYTYLDNPTAGRVTADGKFLVAVAESSDSIAVYDISSSETVARSPAVVGWVAGDSQALNAPTALALSNSDSRYAYVVGEDGSYLTVVDVGTQPTAPAVVGRVYDRTKLQKPVSVAVTPDDKYVCVVNYVSTLNWLSNSLAVVDVGTDPANPKVLGTITLYAAYRVAVSADGRHCIVTGRETKVVYIVDVVTDPYNPALVGQYRDWGSFDSPGDISLSPNHEYAFLSMTFSDQMSVMDLRNITGPTLAGYSVSDVHLLNAPSESVISGDGRHAYVLTSGANTFAAFELATVDETTMTTPLTTTTATATTTTTADTTTTTADQATFATPMVTIPAGTTAASPPKATTPAHRKPTAPGKPPIGFTKDLRQLTTVQQPLPQCSCSAGYDQEGHTISAQDGVATAADCCALCADDDACDCAVLAHNINGGHCMLKSDCTMSYVGGTDRTFCQKTKDEAACAWWNCS